MSGDFDPRDLDPRERDDRIHDREEEWLVIGRGPGSATLREDSIAVDTRERNEDRRDYYNSFSAAKSPASNASFFARDQRLSCRSRCRQSPRTCAASTTFAGQI